MTPTFNCLLCLLTYEDSGVCPQCEGPLTSSVYPYIGPGFHRTNRAGSEIRQRSRTGDGDVARGTEVKYIIAAFVLALSLGLSAHAQSSSTYTENPITGATVEQNSDGSSSTYTRNRITGSIERQGSDGSSSSYTANRITGSTYQRNSDGSSSIYSHNPITGSTYRQGSDGSSSYYTRNPITGSVSQRNSDGSSSTYTRNPVTGSVHRQDSPRY
jgi:hypothetical protein